MAKICVIGTSNIKHISLISLYTHYFDEKGVAYDVIYLDRYGIEENTSAENMFKYESKEFSSGFTKVTELLKFRRFAIKKINENKYDLVIVWQTTTAYLLFDYLKRNYKGRYIINVRDFTYEGKKIVQMMLKKLVDNAMFVTISSRGFLDFLPKHEYVLVNSINCDLIDTIERKPISDFDGTVRVGFVGNCRYFAESYKLINSLGNDNRFEIWYCGTNSEVLKTYAEENSIKNVKTIPAFAPEDTISIMSKYDIINSAFGNDAMDNRLLMPIRLYTAVALGIPTLVNDKTQLAKEVEQASIGFVIDNYDGLPDKLYAYIMNLDKALFCKKCDLYLKEAKEENKVFYKMLDNALGGML